jgi:hypothetical protein
LKGETPTISIYLFLSEVYEKVRSVAEKGILFEEVGILGFGEGSGKVLVAVEVLGVVEGIPVFAEEIPVYAKEILVAEVANQVSEATWENQEE